MGSAVLYYAGREENSHQSHFLEACSLCQKSLGRNSDIFMYRGDTPFCSQECRQEQIEMDEAKERKSWKVSSSSSSSKRALRQAAAAAAAAAEPTKKPSSPNKGVRAGTVAVA